MTVTGGLRSRLLLDSFFYNVDHTLHEFGWHDPGRSHTPIVCGMDPGPNRNPEPLNALVVSAAGHTSEFVEMGSGLATDTLAMTITFYAETAKLGVHLLNDLRDAFRGRMGTLFQPSGSFAIFDYRMATPTPLGYAQVISAEIARRVPVTSRDFERHLMRLECLVQNTYYAEVT